MAKSERFTLEHGLRGGTVITDKQTGRTTWVPFSILKEVERVLEELFPSE